MNTLSRTVTGIVAIVLGAFLIIIALLFVIWALIYGIPILIIGFFIFFNKKEDNIEEIRSSKKGDRGKK